MWHDEGSIQRQLATGSDLPAGTLRSSTLRMSAGAASRALYVASLAGSSRAKAARFSPATVHRFGYSSVGTMPSACGSGRRRPSSTRLQRAQFYPEHGTSTSWIMQRYAALHAVFTCEKAAWLSLSSACQGGTAARAHRLSAVTMPLRRSVSSATNPASLWRNTRVSSTGTNRHCSHALPRSQAAW